jgi:diphosphomevalonate decarboxylase
MKVFESFLNIEPSSFKTSWRSPSNIAFVKYWGKRDHQIPANPSLSLTLKECFTETKVTFSPSQMMNLELYLDGVRSPSFEGKINSFLRGLSLPILSKTSMVVETTNTFPHGAGIASSASGLSAFSLCLVDYLFASSGTESKNFLQTASFISRLASGSACRSLYPGFVSWGESESLENSSDLYATPLEVHPDLRNLRDSILVVSSEEKKISSTQGHGRMNEHPFASARFLQARNNYSLMIDALRSGDMETMGKILELEALSLHAMMLTSPDAFTHLKPNTLAAIDLIWAFRNETKLPLYFTLDAGPNLHLIYPEKSSHKIKTFITLELSKLGSTVIDDERGEGPVKC